MAGLAHGDLPVGNDRIIAALGAGVKFLSRLRCVSRPFKVAATAALNGPEELHSRDARYLPQAPRCAGGGHLAGRGGKFRRPAPRCLRGAPLPKAFRDVGKQCSSRP